MRAIPLSIVNIHWRKNSLTWLLKCVFSTQGMTILTKSDIYIILYVYITQKILVCFHQTMERRWLVELTPVNFLGLNTPSANPNLTIYIYSIYTVYTVYNIHMYINPENSGCFHYLPSGYFSHSSFENHHWKLR